MYMKKNYSPYFKKFNPIYMLFNENQTNKKSLIVQAFLHIAIDFNLISRYSIIAVSYHDTDIDRERHDLSLINYYLME